MIGALITEVLLELGHDICGTAATESDAVDAAARLAPDLMILDVYLKAGDGISAMNTILQDTAMPHIFMTGDSRRVMSAGATVLHKPFGVAGLAAALDKVARQIAAREEGPCHPEQ